MSRRRGLFEHRTSIFEGSYRAWSHLGGLDPDDLKRKAVKDLDPLAYEIKDDPRFFHKNEELYKESQRKNGVVYIVYPYEALPRVGLAHPYVRAILTYWLDTDLNDPAIQTGLTTLRTWWQHRRRGETGTAMLSLGTEQMKTIVTSLSSQFFRLAYSLVVLDKVRPPPTLHSKIILQEKLYDKQNKKRPSELQAEKLVVLAIKAGVEGFIPGDSYAGMVPKHTSTLKCRRVSFREDDCSVDKNDNSIPSMKPTYNANSLENTHVHFKVDQVPPENNNSTEFQGSNSESNEKCHSSSNSATTKTTVKILDIDDDQTSSEMAKLYEELITRAKSLSENDPSAKCLHQMLDSCARLEYTTNGASLSNSNRNYIPIPCLQISDPTIGINNAESLCQQGDDDVEYTSLVTKYKKQVTCALAKSGLTQKEIRRQLERIKGHSDTGAKLREAQSLQTILQARLICATKVHTKAMEEVDRLENKELILGTKNISRSQQENFRNFVKRQKTRAKNLQETVQELSYDIKENEHCLRKMTSDIGLDSSSYILRDWNKQIYSVEKH